MESIEFISEYHKMINDIAEIIKDEYQPLISKMRDKDPHDLITPDTWFPNYQSALGFIMNIILSSKTEI